MVTSCKPKMPLSISLLQEMASRIAERWSNRACPRREVNQGFRHNLERACCPAESKIVSCCWKSQVLRSQPSICRARVAPIAIRPVSVKHARRNLGWRGKVQQKIVFNIGFPHYNGKPITLWLGYRTVRSCLRWFDVLVATRPIVCLPAQNWYPI